MEHQIRKADTRDIPAIIGIDHVAALEEYRRYFIETSASNGTAWVALQGLIPIAYAVLDYTFYSQGFVSILYVGTDHRRMGVGTALIRHLESQCQTEKLFTSTNQSNRPMHRLLGKAGFESSGVIYNLDQGDPEIVFFKRKDG